jgi:hypothetical protein
MCGIEGSKRDAANMIRSIAWSSKPERWIAEVVSRAGWQPPGCGLGGLGAQGGFGLDRGHGGWVVGEVQAMAGAELDH